MHAYQNVRTLSIQTAFVATVTLNHLIRMSLSYWRRPNQHRNFGIVKGVGWRRVLKHEIDSGNRSSL
jgi:hypothetical protein